MSSDPIYPENRGSLRMLAGMAGACALVLVFSVTVYRASVAVREDSRQLVERMKQRDAERAAAAEAWEKDCKLNRQGDVLDLPRLPRLCVPKGMVLSIEGR